MAKIEEITALLIEEIESFQKAVNQLSKDTDKIQNHKISVDTSQVQLVFKEFNSELTSNLKEQQNQIRTLQNKLNKTIIVPKWMIVLFSSFFIICLLSISINFHQYLNSKNIEETSYTKGREEITNHIQEFFKKNPEALKQYQKWKNND
ncbi:DUF6730 family protein [Tenacibaculum mesophilum]|uniref:DUF6730 family protein n=1 Tax=Tenacibaculum mesophilum TaxID=104268 RepID=UPI000649409C|nr:DUF6730 family protein [Tenacibaculum mesophilum]